MSDNTDKPFWKYIAVTALCLVFVGLIMNFITANRKLADEEAYRRRQESVARKLRAKEEQKERIQAAKDRDARFKERDLFGLSSTEMEVYLQLLESEAYQASGDQ